MLPELFRDRLEGVLDGLLPQFPPVRLAELGFEAVERILPLDPCPIRREKLDLELLGPLEVDGTDPDAFPLPTGQRARGGVSDRNALACEGPRPAEIERTHVLMRPV